MEYAYAIMLGFFATHELDAMEKKEWRVLPLTSFFSDDLGKKIFLWAHVPLFALIILAGTDAESKFALSLSGFAIVHVFLHWIFRKHPEYRFNNPGSWMLILGAGFFGALHIFLYATT